MGEPELVRCHLYVCIFRGPVLYYYGDEWGELELVRGHFYTCIYFGAQYCYY